MDKRVKPTSIMILAVIVFAVILIVVKNFTNNSVETPEEIIKCIGENSVLYIQLGCHACETQEQMFGENYQYLNVVDCFYEMENCSGISATPTWEIDGELYKGVQSIEKLQELTGC